MYLLGLPWWPSLQNRPEEGDLTEALERVLAQGGGGEESQAPSVVQVAVARLWGGHDRDKAAGATDPHRQLRVGAPGSVTRLVEQGRGLFWGFRGKHRTAGPTRLPRQCGGCVALGAGPP